MEASESRTAASEERARPATALLAAVRRLSPAESPYWLTRFVLLRGLGFVYVVAFLVLLNQLLPLLGSDGLTPVQSLMDSARPPGESRVEAFVRLPTLFWFAASDATMIALACAGLALATLVLLGFANGLMLFALWLLYLSFVRVGQVWYGFGWETLLLELGFLSIFLCPFLDARPFPTFATPRVTIWLFRWLLFRLMLGAGLIKLRGDPCWVELSCLESHFETQPIPHPLSWYFHHLPAALLRGGVVINHLVEVVAPFFVFGPRRLRWLAGGAIVAFQVMLISSGNLAFLNWLTIVIALACFDDAVFERGLPQRLVSACTRARASARRAPLATAAAWSFASVVAVLSIAPVQNLLSSDQVMNTSFDRLRLVNTYGMFGSVGRERPELVIEGTLAETVDDDSEWREYAWKCKPGAPATAPCLITPYHLRLDWLVWFAAMSSYGNHPWVVHLVWKLLHADPGALSLLAGDPFDGQPPRWIRIELYDYEFTEPGDPSGDWWHRTWVRSYLPAVAANDESLIAFLQQRGWAANETPTLPARH